MIIQINGYLLSNPSVRRSLFSCYSWRAKKDRDDLCHLSEWGGSDAASRHHWLLWYSLSSPAQSHPASCHCFFFDNSMSFLALMLLCPPLDPTSHNSIFPTVDCFSSLLFYRSLQIFVLGYSTYSQASVFSLLDIPSSSTFIFTRRTFSCLSYLAFSIQLRTTGEQDRDIDLGTSSCLPARRL